MNRSLRSKQELIEWLKQPTEKCYTDAIDYLYDTEWEKTLRTLRRYNCTEDEARELFQDALIVVTKEINEIEFRKSVGAYLRGICVKMRISNFRKKGLDILPLDDINEFQELEGISSELKAIDIELISRSEDAQLLEGLRRLMELLTKNCRKILIQKYYGGYSNKEIALDHSIRPQSASTKLYRCLERCRLLLDENPDLRNLLRGRL